MPEPRRRLLRARDPPVVVARGQPARSREALEALLARLGRMTAGGAKPRIICAVPVFRLDERVAFPPPELAEDGLLAVGGDLRPERLLTAYAQGIFPWYEDGLPILWHSPDPRMVLRAEDLHVAAQPGQDDAPADLPGHARLRVPRRGRGLRVDATGRGRKAPGSPRR